MILKKIISVILTVCIMSMSFSSLVSANAQTKDEQNNVQTAESPNIENGQKNQIDQTNQNEFVINSTNDFSNFMKNSDDEGNPCNYWEGNYKITLTCDIGMGDKTFKPIETFNGQFDGNGHTVSNLTIQSSSSQNKNFKLAFIKTLSEGATFKNIMFNNYTIEDTASVKDITYQSAGFVLNNYGTISSAKIQHGTMVNVNKSKNGDAAGFVRVNEKGATIENCSINMKSEKSNINAGFVSYNFGTINDSSTNLPVNYGENAGGFVSENFGTINWCTSEGEVTGKNCLGGFCGYNKGLLNNGGEGIIENCTSAGNVTANTSKSQVICGGFIGQNGGDIIKCNIDSINVNGGEYIGGFCGYNRESAEIKGCTAKKCKVKSSTWLSSICCGGFVGKNRGTIICTKDDKGNIIDKCEFSGEVNGCLDTEKLLAIGVSLAVAAALIVGVIYYVIAKHNSKSIENSKDIKKYKNNDSSTNDDFDIMNYHNSFCGTVNSSLIIQGEENIRKFNSSYRGVLESIFKKFKKSEILKTITLTTIVACIASVVTGIVIEETAKNAYVGGFCGYNVNKINNSISNSKIEAKSLYNKYTRCGGFVGTNEGVLENCGAYGEGGPNGKIEFKMHAGGYLGGFVGENISNIYNCECLINVKNGKCTGGFCGYNEGGISESTSYGIAETNAKTSTNTTRCGGFVGYHKKGMINVCESIGDATGQEYVGGFCGDNVAKIINCKSTGSATAKAKIKTTKCGGFVGENSGTIDNSNCNSKESVKGQEYVGGFVGMNKSDINNCSCITESVKSKTETHNAYAGGFVGVNSDGTITECNTTNSSKETNVFKKPISVEAKSNSGQAKVGGFVGVNKAKIKNSNSIGHHIYLSSGVCWEDNGCGGFVGKNDKIGKTECAKDKDSEVEIDNCYAKEGVDNIACIVETTPGNKGGGFVGEAEKGSKIKNSKCKTVRLKKKKEIEQPGFCYKGDNKYRIDGCDAE